MTREAVGVRLKQFLGWGSDEPTSSLGLTRGTIQFNKPIDSERRRRNVRLRRLALPRRDYQVYAKALTGAVETGITVYNPTITEQHLLAGHPELISQIEELSGFASFETEDPIGELGAHISSSAAITFRSGSQTGIRLLGSSDANLQQNIALTVNDGLEESAIEAFVVYPEEEQPQLAA